MSMGGKNTHKEEYEYAIPGKGTLCCGVYKSIIPTATFDVCNVIGLA